jgi:DNA-binding transcriptional ArsR family regulator
MIRFRFGPDDFLRTRFAVSPLLELASSVGVLRDPGEHSLHLPWVRAVRDRVGEHPMLDALVPVRGYTPDFIAPPPESPLPDVEAEIGRVGRTAASAVARELGWLFDNRPVPAVLRPLLETPRRGLRRLVREMSDYWAAGLEPFWSDIGSVLEDDIAHRARLLVTGGPIEAFADLHVDVGWRDEGIEIDHPHEASVDLRGRGLQLVPAVFLWPRVSAMVDDPWQPSLIYPPRGAGLLWEPVQPDEHGLDELLGVRRARILALLDREHSTTALARRLPASPAGVSEHLAVLRRAGLVRPRRHGREVLYARTAAGDALLRGVGSTR